MVLTDSGISNFVPVHSGTTLQNYHTPCIVEGLVRKDLEHSIQLPEGEIFVVERIWLPGRGDWEALDPFGPMDDNFRVFEAKDWLLR